jgi:hypothetical protein
MDRRVRVLIRTQWNANASARLALAFSIAIAGSPSDTSVVGFAALSKNAATPIRGLIN